MFSKTAIPTPPCLMTVLIGGSGGYGHMMAILEQRAGLYVLPEHPTGLSAAELRRRYCLTGEFVVPGRR